MQNQPPMKFCPATADLPERFNRLESMLFATRPGCAQTAAQLYVGDLLARAVPPPPTAASPRVVVPTSD